MASAARPAKATPHPNLGAHRISGSSSVVGPFVGPIKWMRVIFTMVLNYI